jgi:hypothetical protein
MSADHRTDRSGGVDTAHDTASGPVAREVSLDGSWAVEGRLHGGYLLRTAVEQAVDADHPHPLAASVHYLSPPDPGPAVVEVERLRTGRRVASSRVRLVQVPAGARTRWPGPSCWCRTASCPPVRTSGAPPAARRCCRRWRGARGCHRGRRPATWSATSSTSTCASTRRARIGRSARASGGPACRAGCAATTRRTPPRWTCSSSPTPCRPVTFDLGLNGWVADARAHRAGCAGLPAPGWVRVTQRARLLRDGWLDEGRPLGTAVEPVGALALPHLVPVGFQAVERRLVGHAGGVGHRVSLGTASHPVTVPAHDRRRPHGPADRR